MNKLERDAADRELQEKYHADPKRFAEAYDFLVDETENPLTYRDRVKNQRLNDLLELFEYLRGEDDTNPLEEWFKQ